MKRGFKKSLALLLAMLMALSVLAVSASATDPTLVSISISEETLTLEKDQTAQLSVLAVYSDNNAKIVKEGVRWSTDDDTYVSVTSAGLVKGVKITESAIKIYANYTEGDVSKEASCEVTVIKAPVAVEKISWNWKNADGTEVSALYAGTNKEYSFAFESKMYTLIPDKPDVTSATLTCVPADALQIDNEKKTFKVNPIDKDTLSITLTLTADGASASCKPASKTFTVYRDIPITKVSWNFKNGTKDPLYNYYEGKDIAVYYFMPTEMGSPTQDYKFTVYPESLKFESIAELCEVTFTSSDERVIVFNEATGRIIPVGNGESDLTITIKTPKGKVFKDKATAHVQGSPYTPVTKVDIGVDKDKTDVEAADYDKDSDTITMMFARQVQLVPNMNDKATLDVKPIEVELDNGETIQTVKKINCTWKIDDTSIATIDKNGLVTAGSGKGTATITLTIDDNGHKYEDTVKFRAKMSWWEVFIAILLSIFTGNWSKVPKYFGMLFN